MFHDWQTSWNVFTFEVTFEVDAPYERNLLAFWLAADGIPLMWMLEPPTFLTKS